jgi:hypothetical protein
MRVCFTSLTSEFAGTQELRLSRLIWSNSLPVFISGRFLVGLLVGLMAASCDYSLGQGIGSLGHVVWWIERLDLALAVIRFILKRILR